MRTYVKESTVVTQETWVLLSEVIALVESIRALEDTRAVWSKGWEAGCNEVILELKELS